jgi:hypothetical protein
MNCPDSGWFSRTCTTFPFASNKVIVTPLVGCGRFSTSREYEMNGKSLTQIGPRNVNANRSGRVVVVLSGTVVDDVVDELVELLVVEDVSGTLLVVCGTLDEEVVDGVVEVLLVLVVDDEVVVVVLDVVDDVVVVDVVVVSSGLHAPK